MKEISVTVNKQCVFLFLVFLSGALKNMYKHIFMCVMCMCVFFLSFLKWIIGTTALFSSRLLLLLLSRFSRVRLRDPVDCSPPGSPVPMQIKTSQIRISFSITCLRLRIFSKDLKPFVFSVNPLLIYFPYFSFWVADVISMSYLCFRETSFVIYYSFAPVCHLSMSLLTVVLPWRVLTFTWLNSSVFCYFWKDFSPLVLKEDLSCGFFGLLVHSTLYVMFKYLICLGVILA